MMAMFSKVLVLVMLLRSSRCGVLAQLQYRPLEGSLYGSHFIARWNGQNAGTVGDQLQLQLIKSGNSSDGTTFGSCGSECFVLVQSWLRLF